jgi:hypothetical protein
VASLIGTDGALLLATDDPAPATTRFYEQDFALWAEAQARALAERDPGALVWVNLAAEIDSFGRSERSESRNCLTVLPSSAERPSKA